MRYALIALSVSTLLMAADEAPKQPTPAELLAVTEAVRDYYKASGAAVQAEAQRDDARGRAQSLQAQLERLYACKLNLDTNVCAPVAAKETK